MKLNREMLEFVKAAVTKPMEVATLFPTSPQLADRLISYLDSRVPGTVVEVGAGTGAITRYLKDRLGSQQTYLGIEINVDMVDFLRKEFRGLRFERGPADQIGEFLDGQHAAAVVSSLPWTVFSPELQSQTLHAIHESLKPGSRFMTYICVNASWYPQARHFTKLLNETFSKVERSPIEWRNIPPATVYVCTK